VSISAVQPGQVLVVKAGERIPADGIVLEGESHTDESLLTGESVPVARGPGSQVVAGSLSTDGVLRIQATNVGADSTISRLVQMVNQCLAGRSDLERMVDRVSRVFVPLVVLIAADSFAIYAMTGVVPLSEALMRSITVLVIACPCALGLATPLAVTAAIGAASRDGILVSDSRVLERLGKIEVAVFDKTGTLTDGCFSLVDYYLRPRPVTEPIAVAVGVDPGPRDKGTKCSPAELEEDHWAAALPRLVAIESYSEHPLGKALVEFGKTFSSFHSEATDIRVHKGEGIIGRVEGEDVFVGNSRMLQRVDTGIDAETNQCALRWQQEGKTVAFFGWSGRVEGVLAFGDKVRDSAS